MFGVLVGLDDVFWRSDFLMRFVKPDIEEKGDVGVATIVEPVDRFIDYDLAGVSFDLAEGFPVADEIGRIEMTGFCVVGGGEPVVEAMLGRSRFVVVVSFEW